jgi:hypothetical protein
MKQLVIAKEELQKIARQGNREELIAQVIGDVYDLELPIPEVIEAVARVERADVGERVRYLVPESVTKAVKTLSSNCEITQTAVVPSASNEVTWTDVVSQEYYACIHKLLKGEYDELAFMGEAIMEALNRYEIRALIAMLASMASSTGNEFTLDTGKTKLDFPKLVEMVRSVAKYGKNLVLITGANVTTDIALMQYDANKFQPVDLKSAGIAQYIPIEELSVEIAGSPTVVLDADEAYLVAVADAKNNKPVLFARRKLQSIANTADTQIVSKERAVISTGNMINVATARNLSKGICGFEEISLTGINSKVVAKFSRA